MDQSLVQQKMLFDMALAQDFVRRSGPEKSRLVEADLSHHVDEVEGSVLYILCVVGAMMRVAFARDAESLKARPQKPIETRWINLAERD